MRWGVHVAFYKHIQLFKIKVPNNFLLLDTDVGHGNHNCAIKHEKCFGLHS